MKSYTKKEQKALGRWGDSLEAVRDSVQKLFDEKLIDKYDLNSLQESIKRLSNNCVQRYTFGRPN